MHAKSNANAAIWHSEMRGKHLYLACEDGSIKKLKVKKERIELMKIVARAETRCLSLAITEDEKFVYGGYEDSSIRKWDTENGNCVLHFVKQTKKQQSQQECRIWKLKLFKEEIIFSGDSKGELCAWDAEHGTLLKAFNHLKADIYSIEVNLKEDIVYATGVDARIISVQRNKADEQWVFLSLFRGQSNDIKSLILLGEHDLISAGVTTDICLYKLNKGCLGDQFGRDSKQQKSAPKLRHVPPFPFRSPVKMSDTTISMLNGNGHQLELLDIQSRQQILRIEKKGDYGIQEFTSDGKYLAYSDCKDTQVFQFDKDDLVLRKLTKKICAKNEIESIPVAQKLFLIDNDNESSKLILVSVDLDIFEIDLGTHAMKKLCSR